MIKRGFPGFVRMVLNQLLNVLACNVLRLAPDSPDARFTHIRIQDGTSFVLKPSLAEASPGRFTSISPAPRRKNKGVEKNEQAVMGNWTGGAAGCTGSEMGHLFYNELSGVAGSSILTSGDPDLSLFSNIQSGFYWSGTVRANNTDLAWVFRFDGFQSWSSRTSPDNKLFAWAVRDGDVAASVLEPSTLLLLSPGLAGIGFTKRRARRP